MNQKIRVHPRSSASDSKQAAVGLWGIIFLFAVMFSALALNRHAAFQTNGFDLGNVNQAIWNTAQGRPLAFTNMAPLQNRLALHVEPILFLFVPFYWLGLGGPKLLLLAQAIVVAAGAWPLYLIARPKIGSPGGIVISLAYLLYPALEAAVLYDFHAVTLAPTFLLFAFYWLERAIAADHLEAPASASSPWRWFALFALLAMACKEDMGFTIAMLGLYVLFIHRRRKPALTIFIVGCGWSLIAIFGIQDLFGGNVQGERYGWLAAALAQPSLIWTHLWEQADLSGYLWGMLAPVAGLALLAPVTLLPTLPSLAINLLSNHGLQWRLEEFHYAAPIAPFIFIAAIRGISWLQGSRGAGGRFRRQGGGSILPNRREEPPLVPALERSSIENPKLQTEGRQDRQSKRISPLLPPPPRSPALLLSRSPAHCFIIRFPYLPLLSRLFPPRSPLPMARGSGASPTRRENGR